MTWWTRKDEPEPDVSEDEEEEDKETEKHDNGKLKGEYRAVKMNADKEELEIDDKDLEEESEICKFAITFYLDVCF